MKKLIILLTLFSLQIAHGNTINNPEIENKAQIMNAAFSCAVLNGWVNNENERKRLFLVGLSNGKDVAKSFKSDVSSNIMNYKSFSDEFILGFMVGVMNASASDEARKKIMDGADGNPDIQKTNAYLAIRDQNCNIIK